MFTESGEESREDEDDSGEEEEEEMCIRDSFKPNLRWYVNIKRKVRSENGQLPSL